VRFLLKRSLRLRCCPVCSPQSSSSVSKLISGTSAPSQIYPSPHFLPSFGRIRVISEWYHWSNGYADRRNRVRGRTFAVTQFPAGRNQSAPSQKGTPSCQSGTREFRCPYFYRNLPPAEKHNKVGLAAILLALPQQRIWWGTRIYI